jgi:hypothetical protein
MEVGLQTVPKQLPNFIICNRFFVQDFLSLLFKTRNDTLLLLSQPQIWYLTSTENVIYIFNKLRFDNLIIRE